jgi:peptidoglycan/LPS O-acetylase OafA/YrhL
LVKVFSAKDWGLSLVFSPLWVNWFLAIIVQIYLIVAVAIFARSQKFLWFVTLLSLASLLPPVKKFVPYGLFLPYWLPFSVGMALSYLVRKGYVLRLDWQRDRAWYVGGICVYGSGVSFLLWLFYAPFPFALAVAFLLWLLYPIDGRVASWLPWRVFKVIGLMSYGLYLVHIPVSHLVMEFIPKPSLFPTQISHPLLYVPLTVFMSYFWFVFFERPGSIRGYLIAVTRPLRTLKAALHEDWRIVFQPSRNGQEKNEEPESRMPTPCLSLSYALLGKGINSSKEGHRLL